MKAQQAGKTERLYETFLEFPVPVVLVILWLVGAVLLTVCAAVLYSYWLLLLQTEAS